MKTIIIIIIVLLLLIIISTTVALAMGLKSKTNEEKTEETIKKRTGDFANAVTASAKKLGIPEGKKGSEKRAQLITEIFSKEARLRPTVGQLTREIGSRPSIFSYFNEYFSKSNIPELEITNAKHDVVKITDNIYANYAFVEFGLGENKSVIARMSFLWKKESDGKWRILLLDSSPLPDVPLPLINYKYADKFSF